MGEMTVEAQVSRSDATNDETLIEGFVEDCRLRNFTQRTIEEYVSCLRILSVFLNTVGASLIELDKHVLRRVLRYLTEERDIAFKTLGNYFTTLSTFCDYLIYEGLAEENLIPSFRKRFVRQYKNVRGNVGAQRKLINVEEMATLLNSILDPRDKAIVTLLAKTGIRRNELIQIDVDDIDWIEQSIQLKPHPKRSNCTVFFDDETARVMKRWMRSRSNYGLTPEKRTLFISERGNRLKRNGIYRLVKKHAERVSLHNPQSKRLEDRFTPHCCRHWFTTHLRRNGMQREFIQELRGDARREAMDIYDHIDKKELKRAYLAAIPVLGIG